MNVTENNYRVVKAQIMAIKKQLEKELLRNHDSIKAIKKRNDEIKSEWKSLVYDMEKVGEIELELEYKFLADIERNCKSCGKLYDRRVGSEDLCPSCFTTNA